MSVGRGRFGRDGVDTLAKRWDGQRPQIWVMRMWTLLDLLEGNQEIIGVSCTERPVLESSDASKRG